MPKCLVVALMFSALFLSAAQTPPKPADLLPKDPRAILEAAGPFYDFGDATLKPWHLKATYQLYDEKGQPAGQGTYEFWWASPGNSHRTWTRSGATRSEWLKPDGSFYRKDGGLQARYFERLIGELWVNPFPDRGLLDSNRTKLDLKMVPAGSKQLACVGATHQVQIGGKLVTPTFSMPDYYCFGPDHPVLRLKSSNQMTTKYDNIVKAQGRYIARQVAVSMADAKLFSASVDVLEGFDPAQVEMQPPADAALVHGVVVPADEASVKTGVVAGALVKKIQPFYPEFAKAAQIQGTVRLAAVIGTDGKVKDVEPLVSPAPSLTIAAMECVKGWQYKPSLFNGNPVEVETIISVVFSLGH
ncbi:MAG TPA: energy transducer TonB [Terracidiphilus sp.]|jgi:TonB family protein|nr:energy transducer TonB [Terracidiphilus sp.]